MQPIGLITREELVAMLERDAEGSRLEFKRDIPMHRQNQEKQVAPGGETPRDRWWMGKSVGEHGRDKLLEEVVAFANAQGGQLFLGIDEEKDTTLAKAICPLPRIADLEGRFRNYLLACVEPRLPQFEVRAIETDGMGGGVLVIEVEPSRLGPHRVTGTLQVPVRRGDKCLPMTMPEVHEMVLRNARRFDEVQATLSSRIKGLDSEFSEFLEGRGLHPGVSEWKDLGAYGMRIVVCAHDDLGISRLPAFDPLIPPQSCIAEQTVHGPRPWANTAAIWARSNRSEKFLGGVRQVTRWGNTGLIGGYVEFRASREGVVEQTLFLVHRPDQIIQTPEHFAAYFGCCMGIYDRLRNIAGRPTMPAEVAVSALARGNVYTGPSLQTAPLLGKRIPAKSDFPRRTISDTTDCSDLLNVSIQDLLDAADVQGSPPKFVYSTSLESSG